MNSKPIFGWYDLCMMGSIILFDDGSIRLLKGDKLTILYSGNEENIPITPSNDEDKDLKKNPFKSRP